MPRYGVEELREFDLRCIEKANKLLPIAPPETLFHLVQAEEIYDVAARGLPGRYSHYQFGRQYEQQKGEYDKGHGRIYELVINTRPVHAYLLDGNSLTAQLFVIAHVYGHALMFEHNKYFEPADKKILGRVKSAAERIEDYIAAHGRTQVEDFIDSCESLSQQRSLDQFTKPRTPRPPEPEDILYAELFPTEHKEKREEHKAKKEAYKVRFPKEPERDILAFIEKHARLLEDWQRDIISIIRTERDYFIPQIRTKILNEGVASYYHQNIVHELMAEDESFTTEQFAEFISMNAGVFHPHIRYYKDEDPAEPTIWVECVGVNPYLLGYTILTDIRRACTDPTEAELDGNNREYRPWAGKADPAEMLAEVIQNYDDAALLAEFLTRRVCEKSKLFLQPRTKEQYRDLHLTWDEFDLIRSQLVSEKMDFGIPHIEIVDADGAGQGQLWLVHRHEGIGLDDEYARGTLLELVQLWKHPIIIETLNDDGERCWYRAKTAATKANDITKLSSRPTS